MTYRTYLPTVRCRIFLVANLFKYSYVRKPYDPTSLPLTSQQNFDKHLISTVWCCHGDDIRVALQFNRSLPRPWILIQNGIYISYPEGILKFRKLLSYTLQPRIHIQRRGQFFFLIFWTVNYTILCSYPVKYSLSIKLNSFFVW